MNHRISRRMIVVFVVLLLTSLIATSVAAMGLALREAQQSSLKEEMRRMGCDIVDVLFTSRLIAEGQRNANRTMWRSVGLDADFTGGVSVTDIMMQGFLWANEFPRAMTAPLRETGKAVGPTSTFSPADIEAIRLIPCVRDLWLDMYGISLLSLQVNRAQRTILSIPMQPGQLDLWKLPIERGRDFGPNDGHSDVIIGRTLADLLFPGRDPVGQTISDEGMPLRIIGVLALREGGMASANGFASPYSDPNSTVFRYSPALAAGQAKETQGMQILADPGKGLSVAKEVQRMFRAKENADTTILASSRSSLVPNVVGIAIRTRTLALVSSYALLTLLGCLLAVAVSLYTEFATRVHEIAVRRALGVSRRSVTLGFVAEACAIAAAAWGTSSLVLTTLARSWTRMLQTLLQSRAVDVLNQARSTAIAEKQVGYADISLHLSPLAFLASLTLLLAIAVLSSLIPARGISRINPGAGIRFRGGVRSRFDALKLDLWGSLVIALCLLFALLPLCELSFGLKRDREFALLLGRNVARISTSQSTPPTAKQLQLIKERLAQVGHTVAELRDSDVYWTTSDGDPHKWIRVLSGDATLPAFYGLTPVNGTSMGASQEAVGLEAFAGPDVWNQIDKTPHLEGGSLGSTLLNKGFVPIVGQFRRTSSLTMNRTLFTTMDTRISYAQNWIMTTHLLVGGVQPGMLQSVKDIVRSCVSPTVFASLGFLDGGELVEAVDASTQVLAGFLMLFAALGLLQGFIVFADQLYLYAQLKRRDTAVRKALGTSQAQLTRLHLFHNVLVAGVSVVIGTLLMVLTATLTERPSYALTATSLPWLAATCLLALIVSLIAARNQARRSRNVVPSRELRNL
jgi:ABC-type antimicrobial peptide transport system permease subunit